jgi:hypothetical protein
MCRSIAEGGRRCPGSTSTSRRRAARNVRRDLAGYEQALADAEKTGDQRAIFIARARRAAGELTLQPAVDLPARPLPADYCKLAAATLTGSGTASPPTADPDMPASPLAAAPAGSLPLQGFQSRSGRPLEPAAVQPVRNRPRMPQPTGGLWTSTVTDNGRGGTTAWTGWAHTEGLTQGPTQLWMVGAASDARIYQLDTVADWQALAARYPGPEPSWVDWEAAAATFDAVQLTGDGQQQLASRVTDPLYGWEVECTLWFRPAFTVLGHAATQPATPT